MRICLVNLDFYPWRSSGLAVYGETLALGLAERGHEVILIAGQRPGLPTRHEVQGVSVYRVPMGRWDWPRFAWHAAQKASRLKRERHLDLVHFLDVHFAYRYRGPFLASLHQSFDQRLRCRAGGPMDQTRPRRWARGAYYHAARLLAEAPSVQRANQLISVSKTTANAFATRYAIPPDRLHVVPTGIDLTRFRPGSGQDVRERVGYHGPLLLFVGFVTPRKGLDDLALALRRVRSDLRLLLVGRWQPGYQRRFELLLGDARHKVIPVGYVPDDQLPAYYQAADLLVLPSLLEGFGLPLVEAMACGTPVLATDAGAIPEVVGPGGHLVPPQNPEALAQAIEGLLSDTKTLRRLSEHALRWARSRYDRRRMIDDYERIYALALGNTPPSD